MWSLVALVPATAAVWALLLVLLLREAPRPAWPAAIIGAGIAVLAGSLVAGLKYPSWEALLILLGAPLLALAVTAGHPVRLLDPKWTTPEEEITEQAEAEADRYAWRVVLSVTLGVVFFMITFGW